MEEDSQAHDYSRGWVDAIQAGVGRDASKALSRSEREYWVLSKQKLKELVLLN